jgi:hypothetical protein
LIGVQKGKVSMASTVEKIIEDFDQRIRIQMGTSIGRAAAPTSVMREVALRSSEGWLRDLALAEADRRDRLES